jgi:hypothetical protein
MKYKTMDPIADAVYRTSLSKVLFLGVAAESPLHLIPGDRACLLTLPAAVPIDSLADRFDTALRALGFRQRCVPCDLCHSVLVVPSFADVGDLSLRFRRAVRRAWSP